MDSWWPGNLGGILSGRCTPRGSVEPEQIDGEDGRGTWDWVDERRPVEAGDPGQTAPSREDDMDCAKVMEPWVCLGFSLERKVSILPKRKDGQGGNSATKWRLSTSTSREPLLHLSCCGSSRV